MTADPAAVSAAPSLADFEPLRRAERALLKACARGDIARVGLRRPDAASADVTVRASLIAFLVRGGGRVSGRRIQLLGAWVEGRLDLGESRVPASLWFYRCVFDNTPLFDGAQVEGALSFPDCVLPGLLADRCRITQDLALNAGCRIAEELRLQQAHIGGDLNCARLVLSSEDGDRVGRRPLQADGLRVAGSVRLTEGFEASGEVRFVGARVRGDWLASRAHLTGPVDSGGARRTALLLDRIHVGGDLRLDEGFAAAGRVSLRRARVGGDLDCTGAAFDRVGDATWGDGIALALDRARIGGALRLRGLQGPLLGASFAGTRVGTLVDDASTWGERLVLDGFAYSSFGEGAPLDAPFRLAWLERQPPAHLEGDFRMHPWHRAIAVLRRMGHVHSAGEIALRRERRLRRIGLIGGGAPPALRWLSRGAHALFGLLAGYGWRPQRLGAWAAAVWLASAALFWVAAEDGAIVATPAIDAAAPFSPLAYSLDLLLPLVDLQQRHAWAPVVRAPRQHAQFDFDWSDGVRLVGRFEAVFGWSAALLLFASLAGWGDRDRRR